ncbi:MAG: pirin family protein, partial [Chitinophagaceae bacterium]|nr:pirin family protein [Chitinophagaceae bacterium]
MDRKDFIKKGLMGTGFFVSSAAMGEALINNVDELKPLDLIGFNHIPNA